MRALTKGIGCFFANILFLQAMLTGDLTIAAMVCLEAGTDKLDRGGWVGFGVPREYSNYEGRFRHKHAFQKLFVKEQIEDVCSP